MSKSSKKIIVIIGILFQIVNLIPSGLPINSPELWLKGTQGFVAYIGMVTIFYEVSDWLSKQLRKYRVN